MRNSLTIFIVFISAFISSILVLSTPINSFMLYALFNRDLIIIVLIIGLVLFHKRLLIIIKSINCLSWIILLSYLFGVFGMEYTTYKFSVPLEGFMITVPLLRNIAKVAPKCN